VALAAAGTEVSFLGQAQVQEARAGQIPGGVEAEVVAVGNGKLLDSGERTEVDVKPGDRILFGKYSGSDIKIDGEEYLILREDEVLGVFA